MAFTQNGVEQLIRTVEETGVLVERETHGFHITGTNLVFPYATITLCLRGSGRAMYDMQEMTQGKNDLGVLLPGHILHPIDNTEDFVFTNVAVSKELLADLQAEIFSHDYDKFNTAPVCHLTDIQAERLLEIMDLLDAIAQHRFGALQYRRQMLISQLAVGYEFINLYRKEQDKQWNNPHEKIFSQFCDLVVLHYREEKELQFYTAQMNVHPKLLNNVVREMTHGLSAKEWIEQYVATRAKRLIESQPDQSFKHISYLLGFSEPSSFYRYFKRVTGITAKEYSTQVSCR